ncbi:hypothetical protein JCM5353_007152 [Sporobolomyces roseus]
MGSSRGRGTGGNSSSTDTSDRQLRHRSQLHDKNLDYPPAADVESLSDDSSESDESDSASPVEERKRETTMNSWPKLSKYTGLQRTQVKHLLSPDKNPQPEPSWTSALVTPPSFADEKQDLESTETTASVNRKANKIALSWKRKIYFGITALACIVIVVLGIVLGLRAYRQREEAGEKAMVDPKLLADHTSLVAQGQDLQAQLGGNVIDHSKDEIHEIDDYDSDEVEDVEVELDGYLGEEEDEEREGKGEVVIQSATPSIAMADTSGHVKIDIPVSSSAPDPLATTASPSKHLVVTASDPALVHESFPDLQELFLGNERFINDTNHESPGLFKALGLGQTPGFAFLGCSDSRVSETLVLGAKVGDLFVTRNIGNQYLVDSLSTESVFSYAISHLGVKHLVVMGHTKCGAVLASIVDESKGSISDIGENRIMTWIRPIRNLYHSSKRSEIVKFHKSLGNKECRAETVTPEIWNALVEENVKRQVDSLGTDPSVLKSWKVWGEGQKESNATIKGDTKEVKSGEHEKRSATEEGEAPVELWIHGWVYDVDTGLIHDLGYSIGPHIKS